MSRSVIVSLVVATSFGVRADDCPPKDRGWFIRVCSEKTEARGFRLEIGMGGLDTSHRYWREWQHSPTGPDETEFDLPIDLLHAKEIWIKPSNLEEGRNVYIGLGFNDHIVYHMDFDGPDDSSGGDEKSRDDHDKFDCP